MDNAWLPLCTLHFGLVFMFLIQQHIPALGHRLFALGVLPQLLHNLSCFLQLTAQVSFFEKADLPGRPAFFFSSVLVISAWCWLFSSQQRPAQRQEIFSSCSVSELTKSWHHMSNLASLFHLML